MQVLKNIKEFEYSGTVPIEVETKKMVGLEGGSNQAGTSMFDKGGAAEMGNLHVLPFLELAAFWTE